MYRRLSGIAWFILTPTICSANSGTSSWEAFASTIAIKCSRYRWRRRNGYLTAINTPGIAPAGVQTSICTNTNLSVIRSGVPATKTLTVGQLNAAIIRHRGSLAGITRGVFLSFIKFYCHPGIVENVMRLFSSLSIKPVAKPSIEAIPPIVG